MRRRLRISIWTGFALAVVAVTLVLTTRMPQTTGPQTTGPQTTGGSDRVDRFGEALLAVQQQEAILLDVREQKEWDRGHLELAQLMPSSILRDPRQREAAVAGLDKAAPIYVHCQRGGRAVTCAALLTDLGFDARALEISYNQMVEGGFDEGAP